MSLLRRSVTIGFRLGITIAPVVWLLLFLQQVDLNLVAVSVRGASTGYLALILAVIAASVLLKALRWQYLLLFTRNCSLVEGCRMLLRLAGMILRAYAINNSLPNGVSLFYRAKDISDKEGVNGSHAFGTIVLETGLDALAVVAMGLFVSMNIALPTLQATILYGYAAFVLGVSVIVLTLAFSGRYGSSRAGIWLGAHLDQWPLGVGRALLWLTRRVGDWLGQRLKEFGLGITVFFSAPGVILPVIFLTAVIWLLEGAFFYFAVQALHLDLGFADTIAVMAFTHVIVGLPAAPGYVGTLEYATVTMLQIFGIANAPAMAYALVVHIFFLLPVTLSGIALLIIEDWEVLANWRKGGGRKEEAIDTQ